jgi:L-ascorbate metabolism protein UlaG (beta-lactamase superfamily)
MNRCTCLDSDRQTSTGEAQADPIPCEGLPIPGGDRVRHVQITKLTHACVQIAEAGRVVVIDPGIWSEPGALLGADAVLVTHEHVDHIDPLRLAGVGLPVYLPRGARLQGVDKLHELDLHWIDPGDEFTVADFKVRAVGGYHAPVLDGGASCPNVGYVVNDTLYHPGDSLQLPDQPVDVLCVPAQASWLHLRDTIAFAQRVAAPRSFAIHDGQINDRGTGAVNDWLAEQVPGFRYLAPREKLE